MSECLIETRGQTRLFCSASIKQLERPQLCLPHSGNAGDRTARPLLLFLWLRKKKKNTFQTYCCATEAVCSFLADDCEHSAVLCGILGTGSY